MALSKMQAMSAKQLLREAIAKREMTAFIGAGLSRRANYPAWSELLVQLATNIGASLPLGVVPVCPRIAEVGQRTVTEVSGDVTAQVVDDLGAAVLVGEEDLAQVLRVEPRRQVGRADQVAEHHRHLAPLRRGDDRCRGLVRPAPGG